MKKENINSAFKKMGIEPPEDNDEKRNELKNKGFNIENPNFLK